jgi:hypothetical protein
MVVGVVGIVCLSVIAIYGYSVVHGDPVFNLTEEKYSQNQTSFIYGYDNDDNIVEITRLHGEENRIWVSSDEMSKYLTAAFVAAEDERFEKHNGVDWKRTIGVTVTMSGEGGSTITQQLIKNLTDQNDVTFVRKFNEILSALNIEKHYENIESNVIKNYHSFDFNLSFERYNRKYIDTLVDYKDSCEIGCEEVENFYGNFTLLAKELTRRWNTSYVIISITSVDKLKRIKEFFLEEHIPYQTVKNTKDLSFGLVNIVSDEYVLTLPIPSEKIFILGENSIFSNVIEKTKIRYK